jgi:O-antigen/teichoic acid export membrane protein
MSKPSHKQAFWFTVINYVGILIGIFSTLFIYPKNKELLGVLRYVEALAQTIYPILLLGASQALINFSPKLNQKNNKKLFNYSLISILLATGLFVFLLFFLSFFPQLKGMKYVYFSLAIAVCLAFVELFKKQSTILQKIAIPTFFDNIIPKIALPIVFLLLLNHIFSQQQALISYSFAYLLILFCVAIYLFSFFKPSFDFNFKSLFLEIKKSDYYKFSFFAFAGSLGSVFAFRIDALMIPKFIGMEALGTFSIGVTLASALAIPAMGIFVLYAPIVSNHLKNNNLIDLNKDYKAVSKFLFFLGMLFFSCVFLGIENLFMLLPTKNNLLPSIPIILILGLNVVINMGTGFNGEIITYSKFYRFNLLAILALVALNISLNLFFIKVLHLGIVAVAIASLVSMVVFNLMKLIFIYRKLRLFPFDFSFLKVIVIMSLVLVIVYFSPNFDHQFYNLIYKCGLSLFLNCFLIYRLKLVYQIHFQVDRFIEKIKKRIL